MSDTTTESEAVRIAREMLAALTGISQARVRLVATRMEQRAIGDALLIYEAQFEARYIEGAGGEKALGSNAESRERALIIARAADTEWTRLSAVQVGLESKHEHQRIALDDLLDAQQVRRYLIRALTPGAGE